MMNAEPIYSHGASRGGNIKGSRKEAPISDNRAAGQPSAVRPLKKQKIPCKFAD
jgi:hypothetical protein